MNWGDGASLTVDVCFECLFEPVCMGVGHSFRLVLSVTSGVVAFAIEIIFEAVVCFEGEGF